MGFVCVALVLLGVRGSLLSVPPPHPLAGDPSIGFFDDPCCTAVYCTAGGGPGPPLLQAPAALCGHRRQQGHRHEGGAGAGDCLTFVSCSCPSFLPFLECLFAGVQGSRRERGSGPCDCLLGLRLCPRSPAPHPPDTTPLTLTPPPTPLPAGLLRGPRRQALPAALHLPQEEPGEEGGEGRGGVGGGGGGWGMALLPGRLLLPLPVTDAPPPPS